SPDTRRRPRPALFPYTTLFRSDTDTPFAPLRLRIPGVVFMADIELVGRLRRKPGREKARQIRRRFAAVKDERPVVHAIDTPLREIGRAHVRTAVTAKQRLPSPA